VAHMLTWPTRVRGTLHVFIGTMSTFEGSGWCKQFLLSSTHDEDKTPKSLLWFHDTSSVVNAESIL